MATTQRPQPQASHDGSRRSVGLLGRVRARRAISQPEAKSWLQHPINDEGNTIGHLARLIIFAVVVALALGLAIVPWRDTSQAALTVGAVANQTFKSPRTLTYTSDVRTQEKRDEVANDDRLRVYQRNTNLIVAQQTQFNSDLGKLSEIRSSNGMLDDRVRAMQSVVTDLTNSEARQLLLLDDASWNTVTAAARRLLEDTLSQTVTLEQLAQIKEGLGSRVNQGLSSNERSAAVSLMRSYVKPNLTEDVEATARRRDEARAAVPAVRVTIQEGQTIVRDGDIVTRDQLEQLAKLGLLHSRIQWSALIGTSGLILALVVLLLGYLYRFGRILWRSGQLFLFGLVIIAPIVIARLTVGNNPAWIYAFPIAAATTLTVVLLNLQFATIVALMNAVALGLLAPDGGSLAYTTLAFVASMVGAFLLWNADRIATFFWAGVAVSLSVSLVGICFRLIAGELDPGSLLQLLLLALFNGGVTAVITFGSFAFLGGLFGITTHLQLLELAHPNQPLLYRLAREAPGTYHHSIVVSNLAESAIELVGGDPLFARVAVLYHDIGKTMRPTFFIENQANRENVHDELEPVQSARIIIDHVTDGVRLAQKAHLPVPIIDIIRQHHGTMVLRYFYTKALASGEEVGEEDFRYPGPKPQTKEAGVIMLADGVEAAVRAAAGANKLDFAAEPPRTGAELSRNERPPSKLQDLVHQVIDERVKSGQLDECDLTLRDIERIKTTFVQVLDGIYHPRIDYPPAPAATPAAQVKQPVTAAGQR